MLSRFERQLHLQYAEHYYQLGYTVGLSIGKRLITTFEYQRALASRGIDRWYQNYVSLFGQEWDSISIILNDLVCVDLDTQDIKIYDEMPPTWTEKTPRGLHYFYRLPRDGRPYTCQISYRPHMDLLVKRKQPNTPYGNLNGDTTTWYGHALIAPSKSYLRLKPSGKDIIKKNELPLAPSWITDALIKPVR